MDGPNQTRTFTLLIGLGYLVFGIIAFIPALYTSPAANAPHLQANGSYGYFLSIFPVNWVANVVHIVVGLAGILCARKVASAMYYCRVLFFCFGLLTVAGFIPTLDVFWGLLPIFGDDTWLHAGTALVAAYCGFVALEPSDLPIPAEHLPAH